MAIRLLDNWLPAAGTQPPNTIWPPAATLTTRSPVFLFEYNSHFNSWAFSGINSPCWNETIVHTLNLLAPKDDYSGRTTPLTSKCCILYIYSTNIGTEYFKHGVYSPSFPLQNAVCFIILTDLVPVLFTFYIQGVLKFKKIIPAPKG